MTKELCKDCGKPSISNSPGSVTSYFFQYNYCQCKKNEQRNKPDQNKPSQSGRNSPVCANCGKSRPIDRRAGSFTSFLFKELRCNCAGAVTPKSAASAVSTPNTVRTSTGDRVAQRKQFTESVRNRRLTASNSKSQENLSAGDIVGNTFRIISLVGMGGMGVVYLAEHTALHRQFALKVLAAELVNEQNWLRFQAEAKTLASLNHPTFVKVYDLGIDARLMPFYSMDYLQGYSLEERLMINGPLSLEEAISVFLEVLDGLAYAHRNGIVHRDIKPGNIMICTIDGAKIVKVLDFGISKLVGADARKLQSLTAVGEIFGSPLYMSPEQCMGNTVDARSDIYSIGCTLFEVLTGFVPFEARTALEIMTMHEEQEPPSISDVFPDSQFPSSIDLVLKKCLAKLPQDRYQSAKELAIDLQRIQEGKDVRAYSSGYAKQQKDDKQENTGATNTKYGFLTNGVIYSLLGLLILAIIGGANWLSLSVKSDLASLASDRANRVKAVTHAQIDNSSASYLNSPHTHTTNAFSDTSKSGKLEQISLPAKRSTALFSHITKDSNGKQVKQFDFPKDIYLGRISIGDSAECWEAKGRKQFPVSAKLVLVASPQLMAQVDSFERFRADDLYGIRLFSQAMPALKPATPDSEFILPESYESDIGEALNHMKHMTSLRQLDLAACTGAVDDHVDAINKFSALTNLNVSSTAITSRGLSRLKRLKQLTDLAFEYDSGLPILLRAMAGSEKILNLSIYDRNCRNLTLTDWKIIASCKNLESIYVAGCGVNNQAIAILSGLPHLKFIYAPGNHVDQGAMPYLKKMTSLEGVNFDILIGGERNSRPTWCDRALKEQLPRIKMLSQSRSSGR